MRAGHLIGIPQSASPAMRQAHIRIKTNNLKDASIVQAGIRPGVGGAVKLNELIARRHGKPYSFSHPLLEKILNPTYGIVVFQEQVDRLLQEFGRYSSDEAESIRESILPPKEDNYKELRRQEHKVYDWSSHHESNAQNNGDSYIMDNTPEENHSGSADTASDPKLRRLFSNGAMNILD
jgi:DNA polymerase III alpha subunit